MNSHAHIVGTPRPPQPSEIDREVTALLATATPGSIGSDRSLTASTVGGTKVLALKSATMPERGHGIRALVRDTLLSNRRHALQERMRASLTAAASDSAPPDVTPEEHLNSTIEALKIEVNRADLRNANPTNPDLPEQINGSLLEAARSVIEAYQAVP